MALPSSAALIDNALATGSITADQAAMYRVFADFADPRLPAQLHGDDSSITEADSLLDAAADWPGLSRATQDNLAPFFVPPFYVGSWWDLRRVTASAVRAAAACKPSDSCPVSGDWKYVAGAHIRVWYQVNHPEDQPIAADLVNETDSKIWSEVVRVLGREPILSTVIDGKKLLDVALSDGFAPNVLATTFALQPSTECTGKGAAYILVSRAAAQAADTGDLHSFFAHEVFHAGQLAFAAVPKSCFASSKWLIESTATWFEDQLYRRQINRERPFAHWYLDAPEKAIDDAGYAHARERNYGAYVFFFYLTRVRNLDPAQTMSAIWQAFEQKDSLHAVDAALTQLGAPLDKSWPDFALYSWNEAAPYNRYQTEDGIKDPAMLASTRSISLPFDDVSYEFLSKQAKLPHLSIRYFNFDFPDSTASSIVVYNALQRALGNQLVSRVGTVITANPVTDPASIRGAHIDALLSIGGQWVHEDWTGLPYRTLCRDMKAERVDALFVILSNSSIDNELQIQGKYGPTIQVTNIGCYAWEGSADLRYNEQDSIVDTMKIADLRLEAVGDVPTDANTPARRMFKIVKGSYTWAVNGVSGGCGYSGQFGPQALASPLDFMYAFPYANTRLALAGARGVMTDLGLTWSVPQNLVTRSCGQDVTKVPWSADQFILITTPDQQAVQIGSDGRSLSIDISKVGLSSKGMSGTWTLNAKRE